MYSVPSDSDAESPRQSHRGAACVIDIHTGPRLSGRCSMHIYKRRGVRSFCTTTKYSCHQFKCFNTSSSRNSYMYPDSVLRYPLDLRAGRCAAACALRRSAPLLRVTDRVTRHSLPTLILLSPSRERGTRGGRGDGILDTVCLCTVTWSVTCDCELLSCIVT